MMILIEDLNIIKTRIWGGKLERGGFQIDEYKNKSDLNKRSGLR